MADHSQAGRFHEVSYFMITTGTEGVPLFLRPYDGSCWSCCTHNRFTWYLFPPLVARAHEITYCRAPPARGPFQSTQAYYADRVSVRGIVGLVPHRTLAGCGVAT